VATIRFYAGLLDFRSERERSALVDVSDSPSAKDRIEACGVPHPEVGMILVNGEVVGFGHQLGAGDRVSVFPVFRSLLPDHALRPDPPLGRFVVDVNLGKLAKYLRLLGFDSITDGRLDDGDLAEISASDCRILLTRDRSLLKRSIVVHGYFVRFDHPRDQLIEVVDRFTLQPLMRPFARCMECNGIVEDVAKSDVLQVLEPLTMEHYEVFRRCTACGRVYWKGSHYDRLAALVDEVRASSSRK